MRMVNWAGIGNAVSGEDFHQNGGLFKIDFKY